jgi:hypothetical protein
MLLRIADRFLPDAESGSQRWKVGIGANLVIRRAGI